MCAHEKAELDPLDKLIAIEWDIIHGLLKLLATGRSSKDKVHCANALAHHVNCLNKLLIQRGESPLDDENLPYTLEISPDFPRKLPFLLN